MEFIYDCMIEGHPFCNTLNFGYKRAILCLGDVDFCLNSGFFQALSIGCSVRLLDERCIEEAQRFAEGLAQWPMSLRFLWLLPYRWRQRKRLCRKYLEDRLLFLYHWSCFLTNTARRQYSSERTKVGLLINIVSCLVVNSDGADVGNIEIVITIRITILGIAIIIQSASIVRTSICP